jgi:hypothetical protein
VKSRTKSRRSTSDKRRSFFGFSQPAEARRQTRRLHLESLEERRVLATLYVDSTPGGGNTEFTASGGTQPASVPGLTLGTNLFTTINAAIAVANPGDDINVADGTYGELVNINKSVILRGNQFGVDARGRAATETIVNGNAGTTSFWVNADDVVLDGFTVRDQTNVNQFGAGVWLDPSSAGTEFRNNIVTINVVGLFLSNNDGSNQTVIEQNVFRQNNTPGAASGNGIYLDEYTAGGAVDNVLITNNEFDGNNNAGINFASSNPALPTTNVTISDNAFTGNGVGVGMSHTTNSVITQNTFDGQTSSQIDFRGGNNGVSVAENFIENGGNRGIRVRGVAGSPNQNLTINNNSIDGNANSGLVIEAGGYTGTLNAENNWWGATTGPTGASNPGGTGDALIDSNFQVDISPFLASGTDTQPSTPGFQGNLVAPLGIALVGTGLDDVVIVIATTDNDGTYQVISNGVPGPVVPFTDITYFSFVGIGGNDLLEIRNPAGGLFAPIDGIFYDGGGQTGDTLSNLGGASNVGSYVPTGVDSGVLSHIGAATQTITFDGLAPVNDTVAAPVFAINATAAAETINIVNGPIVGGQTTQVNAATFELINFNNKVAVTVSALGGADIVNVNNPNAAVGLTVLGIDTGGNGDTVNVQQTSAAVVTNVTSSAGDNDIVNIGLAGSTQGILGAINIDNPLGFTEINIDDSADVVARVVQITNASITGISPAAINYVGADISSIDIFAGTAGDTFNVVSTSAPVQVFGNGGTDTMNISSDAPANAGTLDNILGNVRFNPGGQAGDVLNVSDIGDADADAPGLANIGGNVTQLSGIAPANIQYQHAGAGGGLATFTVLMSQGVNTVTINATTAGTSNLWSNGGNDLWTIAGDSLSGQTFIQGNLGNDAFTLNIASHLGASAIAGLPLTGLEINGNDPSADSENRDSLTINDNNAAFSRNLNFDYLDTAGDLDILPGAAGAGYGGAASAAAVNLRGLETVITTSAGVNDTVRVTGTSADDLLTAVPGPAGTGLVFLGGNPYLGTPPETLATAIPGLAGGGQGPDLFIGGIDAVAGLTLDGGAAAGEGNRAIVQAVSESDLLTGGTLDIFGFGAGVLIPGAGAGNAYDTIDVTDSRGEVTNNLLGALTPINLATASFDQTSPDTATQRAGLIVNGGDEAVAQASGISDEITATVSPVFNIQVNGNLPSLVIGPDGLPIGDQLNLVGPGDINIFSDKETPPNVTVTFSDNPGPFGVRYSSIERLYLDAGTLPASGAVNLIGDNNDPTVDQNDNFVVVGRDVDGNSLDGGYQEFTVSINGSAPILVNGVQRLNVLGDDAALTPSAGPNDIDTLELTPYADNGANPPNNAPRGWGIDVYFNEGNPVGADGDQADLLIYHTSAGLGGGGSVSENIAVLPSGPDNGELRVTNAADGSVIVVVQYVANTDIVVLDDDGSLADTDTLTLYGTNPDGPQTSGNETFDADFTNAGTALDPFVAVTDSDSAAILYRLRDFDGFNSINFAGLAGNDTFLVTNRPGLTVNVDGGDPVAGLPVGGIPTSDTLAYRAADDSTISQGTDPSTGTITQPADGPINFAGVELIIAVSQTADSTLTINGTDAGDNFSVQDGGGLVEALVTLNAGPQIAVNYFLDADPENIANLVLNGNAGDDTFSINSNLLDSVAVNGGDPGASDTLIVSSDAGFDPLVLVPTAQGEGSVEHIAGPSPDVAYAEIEHVSLVGELSDGETFGVDGTAGNDLFTYFQGETGDTGRVIGTMDGGFTLPEISFTGFVGSQFNIFGNQGGTDAFAFVGTVSNDEVTYASGIITSSISGLLFTTIEVGTASSGGTTAFVQLEGGDGDDSFEITPEAGVEIFVNGGNPGASDTLVFNGTGGAITVDSANQTITEAGLGPVNYSGIEHIEINGAGAEITMLGSAGNDAFDVTSPMVDEVLVTVNGSGPQFHLIDGTYLFDGNGGTDHLALSGTAGNDTFTSAPGAPNTATVNGTLVSFEETEVFKLIGLDGGDTFNLLPLVDVTTVVDAGGPNTLPGTTPDVLSVTVPLDVRYSQGENSQSGTLDGTGAGEIDFSGIEQITLTTTSGGVLTARGTDDNDTIAADRLGANDLVWINDGPVIGFVGFGTLTLQGRFGDDKFSVTPESMALTTINVDGGDPTASDEVVISGTTAVDTINYSPTAANAGTVQVNAAPIVNLTTVEHLTINGLGGNDDLTLTTPAGGERVTYTPGALADQATIALRSLSFGADLLGLGFTNLGTGGSFTLADAGGLADDDLALRGRDTDDTFNVLASGSVQIVTEPAATLVTVSINTTSVRTLILQGLAGDDTFNIPGDHAIPDGIIVEGGDPSASDVLNFTGAGGAVTVDLGAASVTEAGFGAVTYTGIETIDLDAGGVSPTIVATTGDDDLTVTVLSADSGRIVQGLAVQQNGQVSSQTVAPDVLYSNLGGGPLNVDLAGGNDTLVIVGNALAQTFEVDASGAVDIDDIPNGAGSDGAIAFVNAESLSVFGLEGDDTFNVTAGPIPVFIDGGDPIGVQPGDVLNVIGAIGFFAGPENDEGGFLTGGANVSFDHIESLTVSPNGPCPFLILGTNGDDDITVIARDDSYDPLADGVQDFTVSINGGPEILFIDEPELYIDALAGDDDIVIRTPAPNLAAWDVNVYVAGGPPSDGANNEGDRLVVETPGTQTVEYTPTGSDTGTIAIDTSDVGTLDTLITIAPFVFFCDDPVGDPIEFTYTSSDGGVELLEYDGEDGDDVLTIIGTDQADTIVHTPGETTDEGSLRVNNWLRLDYQNVGVGASLTVDGAGGIDTLVALGTSLSDTFDVEAGTGSVLLTNSLGSRIALQQTNVELLTLEGLGGDDSFVLNSTLPYEVVNVHGGEPGGSDSLSIVGAAAVDETFVVNPGSQPTNGEVLVDAVVNAYTGIEHLYLAGNAGDLDALTINDDLRDNLWTVSAGFVGDLVQIDGRESIDVSDFDTISLDNIFGSDRFEVYPTNLVSFATSLTINGDAAGLVDDVLAIYGTAAVDTVTAAGAEITTNGVAVTAGANLVSVEVYGLAGNDDLNLTGFTAYAATIFGGLGNDTIRGGNLADLIYGGEGNDILIGGIGNDILFGEAGNDRFGDTGTGNATPDDPGSDQFHGGDGSDTFVWDPGDGSDVIEGGDGIGDVLIFNGGAATDNFTLSADGTRLSAFRTQGAILLDTADVEVVNLNGLAGADTFAIGDLYATAVQVVNLDYGAADGAVDAATVEGRNVSDNVNITATPNGVAVTGLRYNVNVANPVAGDSDAFTFNGNNGNDTIVSPLDASLTTFFAVSNFTLNGGLGDDYVVGYGNLNGDEGNDTLVGGSEAQTITGGDGDDLIFGGGGADTLFGNAGEDTFVPGFDNAVDSIDGGEDFDTILVQGTSANNRIDATQDAIGQVRYNVSGVNGGTGIVGGAGTETDVVVPGTVEELTIRAGSGDDIIRITQSDSLIVNGQEDFSLRFTVDGGQPGASDRLTVIDDGLGDTTIHRVGGVAGNGSYTIGALAPVLYYDIEFASLNPINPITGGTGADGLGTLFVFKHDPLEENNARTNATHLGANSAINVDPVIDPGPDADFGLPGDEDWYRVVAQHTGTLDFTIYFRQQGDLDNGRAGLPGDGDLQLFAYDASGNLISGFGGNESAPTDQDERIRIPAVEGQTYFFRVVGNADAINIYNITTVNTPAIVPFDLELDDIIAIGTVQAGSTATNVIGNAALSAVNGFYTGKDISFTSGPLNGQRGRVINYIGATRTFVFAANTFTGAPAAGNTFQIESIDTGRSQLDDITRDNTPTIFLRVGDNVLLNDIPENGTAGQPGLPPDGIPITIPFVPSTAVNANAPGFRVAIIHVENNTHSIVGYAQPVVGQPGVYSYTFTTPLADGSHFIAARVEMIDPTSGVPADTGLNQGLGAFSQSLEIVVDTTPPPVFFGLPNVPGDGLLPGSDSGVNPNQSTADDRFTNVVSPGFFGQAEADAVIRMFIDAPQAGFPTGNGIFEPGIDFQVGFDVAEPFDGTNQYPQGYWQVDAININLNSDLFPLDGLRRFFVTAEDVAGNINPSGAQVVQELEIVLDTQGPQITDVTINVPSGAPGDFYNLFDPKPSIDGPTPLVNSIWIEIRDLPNRVLPDFDQPAFKADIASAVGHYLVRGDHNGIIPIQTVNVELDPAVDGQPATGRVQLVFRLPGNPSIPVGMPGNDGVFNTADDIGKPLPDDRFTLTVSEDGIIDYAGNKLDGESNADEPHNSPPPAGYPDVLGVDGVPTGDTLPGGDFVARYTVDARPELGVWAVGSAWLDINGNGMFDPENPDFTNRDFTHILGYTSDDLFSGKFMSVNNPADRNVLFDKLGAYGRVGTDRFRWLIDTDNDGVPDIEFAEPAGQGINGKPVAGNFAPGFAGDEVGVFTGTSWHLDTDHDFSVVDAGGSVVIPWSAPQGHGIVGDFDGDGRDDLASWSNDVFYFDLSSIGAGGPLPGNPGINGTIDRQFKFGFIGPGERPVAADMNQDGIEDVGLWVPARDGVTPREGSEWYFLVSGVVGNNTAGPGNPPLGANIGPSITGGNYPVAADGPGAYQTPGQYGVASYTNGRIVTDPLFPNAEIVRFEATPFGNDLYMQFGDEFALPLVGNFDPPVAGATGGTTNPRDPHDVDNNGSVNIMDLLGVVNYLTANGSGAVPSGGITTPPYADVTADGTVDILDLLAVVNYLVRQSNTPAEGEAEGEAADEVFGQMDAGSGTTEEDDELLDLLVAGK